MELFSLISGETLLNKFYEGREVAIFAGGSEDDFSTLNLLITEMDI